MALILKCFFWVATCLYLETDIGRQWVPVIAVFLMPYLTVWKAGWGQVPHIFQGLNYGFKERCGTQLTLHGSLSHAAFNGLDRAFCMYCILQTLLLYLEPSKHRFSASLAAKYTLVTSFRHAELWFGSQRADKWIGRSLQLSNRGEMIPWGHRRLWQFTASLVLGRPATTECSSWRQF